jgi:hypothetical protein
MDNPFINTHLASNTDQHTTAPETNTQYQPPTTSVKNKDPKDELFAKMKAFCIHHKYAVPDEFWRFEVRRVKSDKELGIEGCKDPTHTDKVVASEQMATTSCKNIGPDWRVFLTDEIIEHGKQLGTYIVEVYNGFTGIEKTGRRMPREVPGSYPAEDEVLNRHDGELVPVSIDVFTRENIYTILDGITKEPHQLLKGKNYPNIAAVVYNTIELEHGDYRDAAHGILMRYFTCMLWAQEHPEVFWSVRVDKVIQEALDLANSWVQQKHEHNLLVRPKMKVDTGPFYRTREAMREEFERRCGRDA